MRIRPWQLVLALLLLCAGTAGFLYWRSVSRTFGQAELLAMLPPDSASHIWIDVGMLRQSGVLDLLAGSKAAEDADYQHFVQQTGFDYRTDLDAVAGAFVKGDVYLAVRGRFDWKRLAAYAKSQHGACLNAVCDMPAAEPNRYISYEMLGRNVLALANSTAPRGVAMLGPEQWKAAPATTDPVWISVAPFVFADLHNLPAGTEAFLSPLEQAQKISFSVAPVESHFEIRLDVTCASPDAAHSLVATLNRTTDLLKQMIQREHMTPNSRDMSGLLVAGTFHQEDRRVAGAWPMERGFLEALASGQTNHSQ